MGGELNSLVIRGIQTIEAQAGELVSIGGLPVTAIIDYIGKRQTLDPETRHLLGDIAATLCVRKVSLPDRPTVGTAVAARGTSYHLVEVREDDVSYTLYLDTAHR